METKLVRDLYEELDDLRAVAMSHEAEALECEERYRFAGPGLKLSQQYLAMGYNIAADRLGDLMARNGLHPEEA